MDKKAILFPIKLIMGFLIFSEILIWVGPIDYHISNSLTLLVYLIIVNLALYYGYKRGVELAHLSSFKLSDSSLKIILIIGLIAWFRYLVMVWGNHGLSVSFSNLISSIINPGEAYFSESDKGYNGSFIDMIVLDPFRWAAIPLGIAFWKRLSRAFRAVVLLAIFIAIASALGVGIRKGLLDIIIIASFVFLSKNVNLLLNKSYRRRIKWIVFSAVTLFLVYFVFSIASRKGEDLLMISNYSGSVRQTYNGLPGLLTYSLSMVDSYLCQGYYALSEALEMGIRPIAPFGDSWVSMYYSEKLLGYNPMPDTYMAALEPLGIDPRINWHTMYVWLANQYTFIFVPLIIYWVGYSLAATWKDALYGKNDLVFPLLSFFLVMCFYMYANNQVFSDAAISFWIWYMLYYFLRKKSKLKNE